MDLGCHPICDTSFCCSCSSQTSGNPGVQPPGREEPREPGNSGFIPLETLPSRCRHRQHRAVTRVLLPGPASGRKNFPSSIPLPQPPSKHTGNQHSFQHPWAWDRGKKRPKELTWHDLLHCKFTHIMHLTPALCTHSCVSCISCRGTTPPCPTPKGCSTSRWGCALQMLLAPLFVSSATKATSTCSKQTHLPPHSHHFLCLHRKSSCCKQSLFPSFLTQQYKMLAASYTILQYLPFWGSSIFLDFCCAFVVTAFMLMSHLFGYTYKIILFTSVYLVFCAVPNYI